MGVKKSNLRGTFRGTSTIKLMECASESGIRWPNNLCDVVGCFFICDYVASNSFIIIMRHDGACVCTHTYLLPMFNIESILNIGSRYVCIDSILNIGSRHVCVILLTH